MTQRISRRVPFSPSTFFSVVLDVPSYHLFLPFCVASRIVSQQPAAAAGAASSSFTAQLTVGFRVFTESYVSEVRYARPHSIRVRATESSVFSRLESAWTLAAVEGDAEQCDVSFSIDFQVRSAMHAGAVKMFFGDVTQQQMQAFMQRCQQLQQQQQQQTSNRQQPQPAQSQQKQQPLEQRRAKDGSGQPEAARSGAGRRMEAGPGSSRAALASASTDSGPAAVLATAATKPAAAALDTPAQLQPAAQPSASSATRPASPSEAAAVSSPALDFSPAEVEELRIVFRHFAAGLDERQSQRTASEGGVEVAAPAPSLHQMVEEHAQHSSPAEPSPSSASFPQLAHGQYVQEPPASSASSPPLLLSFPAFQHACAFLATPSSSFLSKYRERAALRAAAEDENIAIAAFTGDASLYRYDSSGDDGADAAGGLHSAALSPPQPVHSHHAPPAHLPSRDAAALEGRASAGRARATSQPLQFGRFLEVVWLLSRASNAQKLRAALTRAAAACAASATSASAGSLSLQRLRAETLAAFALQLGVIRHVMPAMVVRRSRDMEGETTPTAAARIPSASQSAGPPLVAGGPDWTRAVRAGHGGRHGERAG